MLEMNFIIYKFMQQEFIIYNLRFVNFHLSIILILNTNRIEIYFFLILIILFSFVLYVIFWLVSKKKLPEVSSWK